MNVTIRAYQDSDLDSCRSLWAELAQHHRDIYDDQTIGGDNPGQEFDQYLKQPDLVGVWVAELATTVIGFSGLMVSGEEAEIEPVIVAKQWRGGIGRPLVEHLIQEARLRGIRFLSVRPVARNIDAISFFVAMGFQIVGQVDLFQELSTPVERHWHEGLILHGHQLHF